VLPDVRRFGYQAAANAIILAKHVHHLLLRRAASPAIEADFKHPGDDAQMYTIFYDELMIELGGKQALWNAVWGGREGAASRPRASISSTAGRFACHGRMNNAVGYRGTNSAVSAIQPQRSLAITPSA
jgi:hypothetical protein